MPVDYGKPIVQFRDNLARHGITLAVVNGRLRIGGNLEILSPAYREEIIKRKDQLMALLISERITQRKMQGRPIDYERADRMRAEALNREMDAQFEQSLDRRSKYAADEYGVINFHLGS